MSIENIRNCFEARQIPIYFGVVALALLAAWAMPDTSSLSGAINPLLVFMLFVTFLQIPMRDLRRAVGNVRFLGALLLANFVLIPLLVAVLLPWVPDEPSIRIGFLLVMLTPCIDYVVTFAHLGRADVRPLLASTPMLLAGQMVLLPLYLGVFLGDAARQYVQWAPFIHAFVWLIMMPLVFAAICQTWARRSPMGRHATHILSVFPVPATAAVLAVVVAAVASQLGQALPAVAHIIPLYVIFAMMAPFVGWLSGTVFRLPPAQKLATAFSASTRNSLVILPLGLAIPNAIPVIPAVIVTQTLVELMAELVYVKVAVRGRWANPTRA